MYQHSDLYNAYHRLPLEPLSGLQYPQFQILLNMVLILKNIKKKKKKKKVSTICFTEIYSRKRLYHQHMQNKVRTFLEFIPSNTGIFREFFEIKLL